MNVKIYATPTCPYCRMTKEYLSSKGIPYEVVDVTASEAYQEEMVKVSGQTSVPVIVINGHVLVGFEKAKIDSLIKN